MFFRRQATIPNINDPNNQAVLGKGTDETVGIGVIEKTKEPKGKFSVPLVILWSRAFAKLLKMEVYNALNQRDDQSPPLFKL